MFEQNLACIRTHRNNIHRYRRLLLTELSDLERGFIDRRMAEEKAALDALVAETPGDTSRRERFIVDFLERGDGS